MQRLKELVFVLFLSLALLCPASDLPMALALQAHGANSFNPDSEQGSFKEPEPEPDLQFAPDRKVDILHVALDVTPDFEKRKISGLATLVFKPIAKPLDELRLDAVDLCVEDLHSTAKIAAYQVTDKEIVVTFSPPIPVDSDTRLSIKYSTTPAKGLYFRVPSNGYPAKEMHMFSQGEMIEARHWFPCYDNPNEKFTSEVTCHVPQGMTVLSNGRLVSTKSDSDGKLVAVHWAQDKPHVSYLICLVAGCFDKLEDNCHGIPLRFYALPSDIKQANIPFANTKPAMEFFEREFGVAYPWAQYGQVVVHDYMYGGMENTSITVMHDIILDVKEWENLNRESERYVAHELAHQWFGDLVTCKDWSQSWLNEGFATYCEALFVGDQHGRDAMLYTLYKERNLVNSMKYESRPIVFRRYKEPVEQFDLRTYQRASWVLHMLNSQLGDALFRKCVRTYLERNQYQNVITENLNAVVEELSGRSYDQFFDQWIYHSGTPELDVNYSWDEKTKLAKVSVRQEQKISDKVPVYQFELPLRFKTKTGVIDRTVSVKHKTEDFYLPLDQAPDIVRVDPELSLLAEISFKPSTNMLYAQLADKSDAIGRVVAAEALSEHKDAKAVEKLKSTLNSDAFYGARVFAADSLKKIHSDEALEALISSTRQDDARVRQEVVEEIGGFFQERALEALLDLLKSEKNPRITACAVVAIGHYHQAAAKEAILKYLKTASYRNVLAISAIEAMRQQDDPVYIDPLKEVLAKKSDDFSSEEYGQALLTLGHLARNEKQRDGVREFIEPFLNNKREMIQVKAIKALGELEDPKSITVLETFASAARHTKQQEAAERAIGELRSVNKRSDNLKDLRREVLDLQKANRELKKDMDDLKKRFRVAEERGTIKKTLPGQSKTRQKGKPGQHDGAGKQMGSDKSSSASNKEG